MATIKGVLFDKDGTLLDFNRTWLLPYQRAAEYLHTRFGKTKNPGQLLEYAGFIAKSQTWLPDSPLASGSNADIISCWEELIEQPLDAAEKQEIETMFTLPSSTSMLVVDDLETLLGQLHTAGIHLGLATMDTENNARSLLNKAGVEELFDFICGADSGYGTKPEAGMIQAFCRASGLQSEQVAMVGDSPKDLKMGRNAQVGFNVGVLSGAHVAADLAPYADCLLADIGGLSAALSERDVTMIE